MGGSKTAIFTQVVHFYSDGVGHITVGGNTTPVDRLVILLHDIVQIFVATHLDVLPLRVLPPQKP